MKFFVAAAVLVVGDGIVDAQSTIVQTFYGTDSTCATTWTKKIIDDYFLQGTSDYNAATSLCTTFASSGSCSAYGDGTYYVYTCESTSISELISGYEGVASYTDTACTTLYAVIF
jgi:hypothetical protein